MKFINVIKPTHVCNLACSYCYNDDERRPFMDSKTLYRVIKETFSFARHINNYESVTFIWHGGEPLLAPLHFYERAIHYQKKLAGKFPYENIIQTNGTLLNNKIIAFFKTHNFQVSLSADGIRPGHDANRRDKKGNGSFDRVMDGFQKLEMSGMKAGCVLVLNSKNIEYLSASYDLFRAGGIGFNIIPLMKGGSATSRFNELSLTQEAYVQAWTTLYDKWLTAPPDEYTDVSCFIHATRAVISGRCTSCTGMAQCGIANCSTDPEGNIYPCASVTGNPDICYGNINHSDLSELFMTRTAKKWRSREYASACMCCRWFHLCHGGCPSRSYHFNNGNYHTPDHYCHSINLIFSHVEKRLRERGIPPGEIRADHLNDGFPDFTTLMREI